MVVGCPFATKVHLEVVGVVLCDGPTLGAPCHSEKVLVVDHMKLGCHIICPEVADDPNRGGVVVGESQELAQSGMGTPL